MRRSSISFERVFVPNRRYSRWALSVWLIQHCVATTGLWLAALSTYVKLGVCVLIVLSAVIAYPQRSRVLARAHNGSWALPEDSRMDLQILPGTHYTRWWAILRFGGTDRQSHTLRLWRDTWSAADWRALLIRLREHRRPPEG